MLVISQQFINSLFEIVSLSLQIGPIFPLSQLPSFRDRAAECLEDGADLEGEYRDDAVRPDLPRVVCRRCCQALAAFSEFRLRAREGRAKMDRILNMRRERRAEQQQKMMQEQQQQEQKPEPEEEQPSTSSSSSAVASILPDLDMDIDDSANPPRVLSPSPSAAASTAASTAASEARPASPPPPAASSSSPRRSLPTVTVAPATEGDLQEEEEEAAKGKGEEEQKEIEAKEVPDKTEEEFGGGEADPLTQQEEDDATVDAVTAAEVSGEEEVAGDGGSPSAVEDGGDTLAFVQVGECRSLEDDVAGAGEDGGDKDLEGAGDGTSAVPGSADEDAGSAEEQEPPAEMVGVDEGDVVGLESPSAENGDMAGDATPGDGDNKDENGGSLFDGAVTSDGAGDGTSDGGDGVSDSNLLLGEEGDDGTLDGILSANSAEGEAEEGTSTAGEVKALLNAEESEDGLTSNDPTEMGGEGTAEEEEDILSSVVEEGGEPEWR